MGTTRIDGCIWSGPSLAKVSVSRNMSMRSHREDKNAGPARSAKAATELQPAAGYQQLWACAPKHIHFVAGNSQCLAPGAALVPPVEQSQPESSGADQAQCISGRDHSHSLALFVHNVYPAHVHEEIEQFRTAISRSNFGVNQHCLFVSRLIMPAASAPQHGVQPPDWSSRLL